MTTIFKNGRFFQPGDGKGKDNTIFDSIAVCDGKILEHGNSSNDAEGAKVVDLEGRLVLPAFVDAHCHLLQLGESLEKVDLTGCTSLSQICQRLEAHRQQHPNEPRILACNWIQGMTTPEEIHRTSFDEFKTPVYIESYDLHSALLNTAALAEVGIEDATPDPAGGTIVRDKKGHATGYMQEMAHLNLVAVYLQNRKTTKEKKSAIERAMSALSQAGYTGVADLLMEEDAWEILTTLHKEQGGRLPLRVRAFWHVKPEEDLEKSMRAIARAKELKELHKSVWLQVIGIKLVTDGVIDSCTASLREPYRNGSNAEPIWPLDRLTAAVQRADELGLQCAIHAIGDLAVHNAVEALANLGRDRIVKLRHRIEHLELSTSADVERIGSLGITTSVQPVHADPALLDNWYAQLDSHCHHRAFAYRDFLEAGAPLAIGTDAPTAPYAPLPNLHIATTRRSARDPALKTQTTAQFAIPLVAAVAAATQGAARACHLDHLQGSLVPGTCADFNVLDLDFFSSSDIESDSSNILLKARVVQTYLQGQLVSPSSSSS